jgi:hypothetical protein
MDHGGSCDEAAHVGCQSNSSQNPAVLGSTKVHADFKNTKYVISLFEKIDQCIIPADWGSIEL